MSRPLAVVTGASGGIGWEICVRLATEGYDLVAQYHSNKTRAAELHERLAGAGVECHLVQADLQSASGIDAVCRTVDHLTQVAQTHELCALINNAAVLLGPSLEHVTAEAFDHYMGLNAAVPLFLTQRLSLLMKAGGSVVNISSASAHIASAGDIIYAMSKAALESFTRNAAIALAPRGVRVNGVIPGFTNNGHPAFKDAQTLAYMSSMAVMGSVGSPRDVAAGVHYLISDESQRTTGSLIDVSGGMTLHPRQSAAHTVRDLL